MLLRLVGVATLILVGVAFSSSAGTVRRTAALATVSLAIALHVCVSLALSLARTEALFQPHVLTGWQPVALVVAAFVDFAGLWGTVALVPWAPLATRALAVAAILGAGALAAPGFYLPFDVVIVNDEIVSPSRIEYTMALVWGIVFLGIGYALGNGLSWWRHHGSATA